MFFICFVFKSIKTFFFFFNLKFIFCEIIPVLKETELHLNRRRQIFKAALSLPMVICPKAKDRKKEWWILLSAINYKKKKAPHCDVWRTSLGNGRGKLKNYVSLNESYPKMTLGEFCKCTEETEWLRNSKISGFCSQINPYI